MKKPLLSILLAVAMMFTLLPTIVFAAEIVDSGICGKNLTWTLDSDGLLTISGTGEMTNYYIPPTEEEPGGIYPIPWGDYRASIKRVYVSDGVTSISGYAFSNCECVFLRGCPSNRRTSFSCI